MFPSQRQLLHNHFFFFKKRGSSKIAWITSSSMKWAQVLLPAMWLQSTSSGGSMPTIVTLSHEPPEDFPGLLHPCLVVVAGHVTLSSPDSPGQGVASPLQG